MYSCMSPLKMHVYCNRRITHSMAKLQAAFDFSFPRPSPVYNMYTYLYIYMYMYVRVNNCSAALLAFVMSSACLDYFQLYDRINTRSLAQQQHQYIHRITPPDDSVQKANEVSEPKKSCMYMYMRVKC